MRILSVMILSLLSSWSFGYDTLVATQNISISAETNSTPVLTLSNLEEDGKTQRTPTGRCYLQHDYKNYDRVVGRGSVFYILSKKVKESSPSLDELNLQVKDFFGFDVSPLVRNKKEVRSIVQNKYELDVKQLFATYSLKIKSTATDTDLAVKCNLYPVDLTKEAVLNMLSGSPKALLVPGRSL